MKKLFIRQVEAFRAVVTLRSMSKAAEMMGISQPAVSRLIADFQDTAGFQLFKRRRNSAEPTPDALLLFEQVEKVFYGLEELSREISAINSMHTGRLAIAATSSYAIGFLPQLIAAFKQQYPNITIAFHIQSHDQVIDWVSSGRADIGFAIQSVANAELTTAQLISRNAHCIMPAGHELDVGQSLVPKDLADRPFVSFPRGSALRYQIDGVFDRLGIERQLHAEATSHHAVCSLVSAGLGVALVSPFAPIDGYPNKLVSHPMKPSLKFDLQMICNESMLSVTSTHFRDFIVEAVPKWFATDQGGQEDREKTVGKKTVTA